MSNDPPKQEQKQIKQNENKNNDKGYNKSKNRYGVNPGKVLLFNTLSQNFEGEESSIRVVLGMRFEKLRRK